jgi:hypothetical protein
MQGSPVPFPCAVYARETTGAEYKFRHFCCSQVSKLLPRSLRTRDLAEYSLSANTARLLREPFLVLVAGDRAQCVSVENASDTDRTWFLYPSSRQSRPVAWPHDIEELETGFVPMTFCSTMATYSAGRLTAVLPVERGPMLMPSSLRERDLARIASMVERKVRLSVEGSVWLVDGDSLNESSLYPKSLKRTRFYSTPDRRPLTDALDLQEPTRNVRRRT